MRGKGEEFSLCLGGCGLEQVSSGSKSKPTLLRGLEVGWFGGGGIPKSVGGFKLTIVTA